MKEQSQDFRQITAETAGKDLLNLLVQEMRLLPDVWQKLSMAKQGDVIDRIRNRVQENVNMVVHVIASQNRTAVAGILDKVTIKGNVEAVIKFGINSGNLPDLFAAAADQESKTVLVVVSDPAAHTRGMDEVTGEDDQRGMDLGHEYHDNDGGGMDDFDASTDEIKGLPSPDEVKPSDAELEQAFADGYGAAEEGRAQSDCPIIRSELVIEWVKGWKAWHDKEGADNREVA